MAANRDHHGAARWRTGAVTALLIGLLAGLGAGAPAGMRLRIAAHDGRLSVDVHQAEIGAVLAQIGAQAGIRIVFAQPAARAVSAQFSGVELDAGLRHLLRLASLNYVMRYGQDPTGAPVVQEVRVYGGEARAGELAAAAPAPEAADAPGPALDHPFRRLREQLEALASRAAAEAPRPAAAWPEAEVVSRLRQVFTPPPVTAPTEDQGPEPPDAAEAQR